MLVDYEYKTEIFNMLSHYSCSIYCQSVLYEKSIPWSSKIKIWWVKPNSSAFFTEGPLRIFSMPMCTVNPQVQDSIKLFPNLLDHGILFLPEYLITSKKLMFSGTYFGKCSNPNKGVLVSLFSSQISSPWLNASNWPLPALLVPFPFGSHWLCFEISMLVILWVFLI